jgi:hypothetical protein
MVDERTTYGKRVLKTNNHARQGGNWKEETYKRSGLNPCPRPALGWWL